MITSSTKPIKALVPPTPSTLSVRVPTPDQSAAFDQQLAAQHYLGAGRPVGDYLRQVVERDGQTLALLVWGPACYALKDRDRWISWSVPQRLERLKLVVQNRRFLLLTPKGANGAYLSFSVFHCVEQDAAFGAAEGFDILTARRF